MNEKEGDEICHDISDMLSKLAISNDSQKLNFIKAMVSDLCANDSETRPVKDSTELSLLLDSVPCASSKNIILKLLEGTFIETSSTKHELILKASRSYVEAFPDAVFDKTITKFINYALSLGGYEEVMSTKQCKDAFNGTKVLTKGLHQFFTNTKATAVIIEYERSIFMDLILERSTSQVKYLFPYNKHLKAGKAKCSLKLYILKKGQLYKENIDENLEHVLQLHLGDCMDCELVYSAYYHLPSNIQNTLHQFLSRKEGELHATCLSSGNFGKSPLHFLSLSHEPKELFEFCQREQPSLDGFLQTMLNFE